MQSLTRGVLGVDPDPGGGSPGPARLALQVWGTLSAGLRHCLPKALLLPRGSSRPGDTPRTREPEAGSREPGASLPLLLPLPLAPPPPLWAEPPQDWPAKPEGGLQVPSPSLQAKFRRVGAELGDDH